MRDFFMESEEKSISTERKWDWFQIFPFAQRKPFTLIEREWQRMEDLRPKERDNHWGAGELSVPGAKGDTGLRERARDARESLPAAPRRVLVWCGAAPPLRLTAKGRHKGNCRLRTGSPTNRVI